MEFLFRRGSISLLFRNSFSMVMSIFALALMGVGAEATEIYFCEVTKKFNSEYIYTMDQLKKYRFSTIVLDYGDKFEIKRCSIGFIGKDSCEEYHELSRVYNSKGNIRKYYFIPGFYDMQIFGNRNFVENNGFGDISFGVCSVR